MKRSTPFYVVGGILGVAGVALYVYSRRRGSDVNGLAGETRKKNGMVLTVHRSRRMPIKERLGHMQDLVWESVKDPAMRKLALQITAHCPARDGECETRAVYNWTRNNIRYTGDIAPIKMGRNGPTEGVDLFQSGLRTTEFKGGDCLPAGTLLLVEGFKLVPIEQVVIGSRIWGLDGWTEIKDIWFKGILPVDAVFLNNGSSFKATGNHHVYVALCKSHPVRWASGDTCSCPMEERAIERIEVSALEPGMVLPQPERLPFGAQAMDPDRAYVEGLFLSDGWSDQESRFAISGKDGCPKEVQKREVQAICERLGIATRWHEKYIAVNDGAWALRMQQMGARAAQKHALSLDLDEGAAAALLRGIMADSGANTNGPGRTFTTTSRDLMLQTRILHKMFGLSCGERYIVDHGGLGEHPIWRLQVRTRAEDRKDGKASKLLRVKAIERDVMDLPVWDLTTADHRVYLPEADVTVSQCDDHSILNATLLALNGITPKFRVTAPRGGGPDSWSHVYVVSGLPKTNPQRWVPVDTTLPGNYYAREAPHGRTADFTHVRHYDVAA